MVTSVEIRERDRKRAYNQTYPELHYYLTATKLFIYSAKPMEWTPRIVFDRTAACYRHERVDLPSIPACLGWALRQPEFKDVALHSKKTA